MSAPFKKGDEVAHLLPDGRVINIGHVTSVATKSVFVGRDQYTIDGRPWSRLYRYDGQRGIVHATAEHREQVRIAGLKQSISNALCRWERIDALPDAAVCAIADALGIK